MLTQKYMNFINELITNAMSNFQKKVNHPNVRYIDMLSSLTLEFEIIIKNSIVSFLERMDYEYRNSDLRKQSYHVKKNEYRNLTTRFGNIRFMRTVYQHIYTGSIFTYVDRSLGLVRYDLYDPDIKGMILEYASDNSDAVTARHISDFINKTSQMKSNISRQFVRHVINSTNLPIPKVEQLPDVDTLYVMADEKFVPTQNDDKHLFVKHAVIFEGMTERYTGQYKLKNKHNIAVVGKGLKTAILDYINTAYDVSKIKMIYVMGDGASWIKKISTYMKFHEESEVIRSLDKFHFKQAVRHISIDEDIQKVIVDYVLNGTKTQLKQLVQILIDRYPHRKEPLTRKLNYLNSHKKEIQLLYEHGLSCPMESQISHNIAALFASRPKGYSRKHFKKRLHLRMMNRNKISIKALYVENLHKNETDLNIQKINKQLFGTFEPMDPISFIDHKGSDRYYSIKA